MYTLRTITGNKTQVNKLIGNTYSLVHRDESYDEFSDMFFNIFGVKHVADLDENSNDFKKNCYGFLSIDINETIPLYKDLSYYIMTESGKTFSNLSY